MAAWGKACACTEPSKILIPKGLFLLSPVTLQGPCKCAVELEVQGTLKASSDNKAGKEGGWVTFQRIDQFTLTGEGIFDGQGEKAWGACGTNFCDKLPIVSF